MPRAVEVWSQQQDHQKIPLGSFFFFIKALIPFITLPTKVCLVKAMVFPVVMYECESWTIKKAEHLKG